MVRTKPINWFVSHCMPTARRTPELRNGLVVVLVTFWASFPGFGTETEISNFSHGQIEFYEKQVQPILAENCYKCHSHQADKIKGSFVLDSREGLLKGGETGPAVVPGAPEKSLLIKAVRHTDEDLQMPPKKTLPDDQIATLAEWIKIGAPYSTTSAVAVTRP